MNITEHADHEHRRLAALETYGLMDSGEEIAYDDIARIAAAICEVPIALITFIDLKRQYFKSHIGTDYTENLRELSFCSHALASAQEIMVVNDATLDERFRENPMVTGPTKLVFYAGVPLVNHQGYALGTICVMDQKKHSLNDAQSAALISLGRQVVDKFELKKRNEELSLNNKELLNSNILIQKFASMAAHDIKNPLTSMLISSQLLQKRVEKLQDVQVTKLMELNISSTRALLGLVDEMLEYSKSPGLLTAKKQSVNIRSLIDRLKNLISIPENCRIELNSSCTELYHSAIALEQILLNLLSNAVRYNDKANGLIEVTIEQHLAEYVLTVRDNGIGIAPEMLDKIFDLNFVGTTSDRFNTAGTGIGLSTVKNLVNMLGGQINVSSTLSEGSSFEITLPV